MSEPQTVSLAIPTPATPYRILVVEDEPEMRALLAKALAAKNRLVAQAADGAEAITRLREQEPFDLVVSDIKMPHRDGHAVLNAVREAHPQTKVILITAFGEIEEYLDTMDRGAYEYINKPLRMSELLQVVERALTEEA